MLTNTKQPQPGDKIIVIDPALKLYANQVWIVTKEPVCGRAFGPYDPEVIWIGPESGPNWPNQHTRVFLYPHQYRLAR